MNNYTTINESNKTPAAKMNSNNKKTLAAKMNSSNKKKKPLYDEMKCYVLGDLQLGPHEMHVFLVPQ